MLDREKQIIRKRYIVKIFGVVQGVGFRPYIYKLAHQYSIGGWVNNSGASLVIDGEGKKIDLKKFILNIIRHPPQLAKIEKIEISSGDWVGYKDFSIRKSNVLEEKFRFISSDVGVCPECAKELTDPKSRWYQYPFTNCTACGPRYSIIEDLPYDRKNTTMKSFEMCPSCKEDYDNPLNRRFHAQPTCCPACGPIFFLVNQKGEVIECENPIVKTVQLIKAGKIIAVKGLGGFHLACNAEDESVVQLLRQRKNRPHKPLAIMAKDLESIKAQCFVNEKEEALLQSNKKPIVLLEKKEICTLPKVIAPDTKKIGWLLPYTPLHLMLFQQGISFLVMTSGNISNDPIQYKEDQVIDALGTVADYFLIHNREIYTPVDDSVTKVFQDNEIVIREGRGYAPFIINIGAKNKILALGAEQKSTFCISKNGYGYMSQYLGDVKDLDTYKLYQRTMKHLIELINVHPEIVAYDMHPSFLFSQNLEKYKGIKVPIQHHHAHMVSCMAEHGLERPVIGVIYDGTGYGIDGNVWGGEFLLGTRKDFKRLGHFKYVTIQGGDQSVKEPWRTALCYLSSLGYASETYLNRIGADRIKVVQQALKANINCYQSSSVGRLFDGVAALLGLCDEISYDAQAPILLENIAAPGIEDFYPMYVDENSRVFRIDYKDLMEGILLDLDSKVAHSIISSKFHNSLCNITVQVVERIREEYKVEQVVLSGGCFENNYLLEKTLNKLETIGMKVFYHQKIPTNDSGISIGQLAIADYIGQEGENVSSSTC